MVCVRFCAPGQWRIRPLVHAVDREIRKQGTTRGASIRQVNVVDVKGRLGVTPGPFVFRQILSNVTIQRIGGPCPLHRCILSFPGFFMIGAFRLGVPMCVSGAAHAGCQGPSQTRSLFHPELEFCSWMPAKRAGLKDSMRAWYL